MRSNCITVWMYSSVVRMRNKKKRSQSSVQGLPTEVVRVHVSLGGEGPEDWRRPMESIFGRRLLTPRKYEHIVGSQIANIRRTGSRKIWAIAPVLNPPVFTVLVFSFTFLSQTLERATNEVQTCLRFCLRSVHKLDGLPSGVMGYCLPCIKFFIRSSHT